MTEQNPNPVLVAVGHDPIESALAFAAGEATRAGCGIHLVHVVHLVPTGSQTILMDQMPLERLGRDALNAALEHARNLVVDTVTVTCELVRGNVVHGLVDAALECRMIVLEHRDLSRMQRLVTRSVAGGVAARARVPVVTVPALWSASDRPASENIVTVGIDDPERCTDLLAAAAAAAASRKAVLHVLHAWSFPEAFEDVIVPPSEAEEWVERATAEIRSVLDPLVGTEDASARIEVRHAAPADALVEASSESQLLVVGRHDPVLPIGSHLGPIARAVIREARCPVMMLDVAPAHDPDSQ